MSPYQGLARASARTLLPGRSISTRAGENFRVPSEVTHEERGCCALTLYLLRRTTANMKLRKRNGCYDLRAYEGVLPRLPREIYERILSFVPSSNKLELQYPARVYVDGILSYVIFHPSLIFPYLPQLSPRKRWKLQEIAKQPIKHTILDNAPLTRSLELHAKVAGVSNGSLKEFIHILQSTNTLHRLKSLYVSPDLRYIALRELTEVWPPNLEDLRVKQYVTIVADSAT